MIKLHKETGEKEKREKYSEWEASAWLWVG